VQTHGQVWLGDTHNSLRLATLKQEVLSLFEHLTRMGDGTIRHLEIKHGLPFLIRIEERAA
jgi:hypothetical protein